MNNPYQILLVAVGVLSVLNLVLLIVFTRRFLRYERRQRTLMAGENVGDLEDVVVGHQKLLDTYGKDIAQLETLLKATIEQNKINLQKVGVVRFNPFADAGANMSFSLALLDGKDNGIVISSLHSREGTRIYGKSIKNGKSEYHLTSEEIQAMDNAKLKVQNAK